MADTPPQVMSAAKAIANETLNYSALYVLDSRAKFETVLVDARDRLMRMGLPRTHTRWINLNSAVLVMREWFDGTA